MACNATLARASRAKNDEFSAQLVDVDAIYRFSRHADERRRMTTGAV